MADRITLYTDEITEDEIINAQHDIFDTDEDGRYGEWDEVPKDATIPFIELDKELLFDEVWSGLKDIADGYCVVSGHYYSNYPDFRPSGDGGTVTRDYNEFYDFFEDCDYWTIEDEDGLLLIKASHHDGTLNVAVKVLTDAGVEWYDEHSGQTSRREVVETLFNSNRYSKKPYLARTLQQIK